MTAPPWGTHPDPTDPHPDCGHEWHGADGGACPRCGWDSHPIPDTAPSGRFIAPWDALDDCGVCVMVAAIGGPVRAAQVACPVHGDPAFGVSDRLSPAPNPDQTRP